MDTLNYQTYYENPANMLYLWATNAFLLKLDKKARDIIFTKRYSQRIIINQIAKKAGKTYQGAIDELAVRFTDLYGVHPKEALDILAAGGSIAGKNWSEGTYGVGALTQRTNFAQNTDITVDPETGLIFYKGSQMGCTPVYKSGKNGTYVSNYTYVDSSGNTWSSYLDSKTGKYIAYQYAPADGGKYNADGQKILAGKMTNDMWQDIMGCIGQVSDWLLKFVNAIMSIFTGSGTASSSDIVAAGDPPKGYDYPKPENTIPKQSDGFIFNSDGSVNWGTVGIIGAGIALLAMRRKGKKAKRD